MIAEDEIVCVRCKAQHDAGSEQIAVRDGWRRDATAKTTPPTYLCPRCQEAALRRYSRA